MRPPYAFHACLIAAAATIGIIAIVGTGYLLGITRGKEYAEPEWYADLWLTARIAISKAQATGARQR
jgi:cbb3-type cytochrome oxidase subunit 1